MDDAIAAIEAAILAAAVVKTPPHAASPGDTTTPPGTGPDTPAPKPTKVVRAADFSSKSYLETDADVEAFVTSLKTELLAAIHAGIKARIQ
jgi:hypothetical protein